ncbi:MAG: arginine-tRNA-protein transferase [Saprospiraceae bacterium]|nr:arginine-tRNA-protein transferase [Saprospiraceae bacterium]
MFTEKHYLDRISGKQLDTYLDKGWYRMGQAVFTCRFLIFNGVLFTSIWIRLSLKNYVFSKRKRKRMNQLNARFRTIIRPFEVTAEKEKLYRIYREQFPAKIAPSLASALLDDTENNIFNTQEIAIYDGDKLIAFSTFDLGEKSIASILGVYHPDYAKFSLGVYTMLLEVQYGQKNGYDLFYPGYVVPGYSKFDYKLQIGEVDYYDELTSKWNPFTNLDLDNLAPQEIEKALVAFGQKLQEIGLKSHIYLYPPYEANLLGYWILDYLDYPLILEVQNGQADMSLILCYDHRSKRYHLYQCTVYDNLDDFFRPFMKIDKPQFPLKFELLIKEKVLLKTHSEAEIILAIQEFIANSDQH